MLNELNQYDCFRSDETIMRWKEFDADNGGYDGVVQMRLASVASSERR